MNWQLAIIIAVVIVLLVKTRKGSCGCSSQNTEGMKDKPWEIIVNNSMLPSKLEVDKEHAKKESNKFNCDEDQNYFIEGFSTNLLENWGRNNTTEPVNDLSEIKYNTSFNNTSRLGGGIRTKRLDLFSGIY